jgi:hypothetical protein
VPTKPKDINAPSDNTNRNPRPTGAHPPPSDPVKPVKPADTPNQNPKDTNNAPSDNTNRNPRTTGAHHPPPSGAKPADNPNHKPKDTNNAPPKAAGHPKPKDNPPPSPNRRGTIEPIWVDETPHLKIRETKPLGSGSFATVYYGTYYGLPVAVKKLHRVYRTDRSMDDFEQESEKLK